MTDTTEAPAAGPGVAEKDHNATAMDVVAMVKEEPKAIFHDSKLLPKLLAQLDDQIEKATADVATSKGRDEIRSRAASIGRLKASIDKGGLELTEDFRKRTKEVNEVRNEVKTALAARDDKARLPLTEWEEKEKAREEKVRSFRDYLEKSLSVPTGTTLEQIDKRVEKIEAIDISEAVFGELVDRVVSEKASALSALHAAKAKIEQDERDRQELQRLREADAERLKREEATRREQAAAEEARILNETRERERQEAIERARQEEADKVLAAERERQSAELARVEEERRQADVKRQMEIDAANRRAEEAETARLEQERIAREEREKRERVEHEAEAQRQRDEEEAEARRLDEVHRATVILAIETDLVANGASNTAAKRIAQALIAGSIRHATVEF